MEITVMVVELLPCVRVSRCVYRKTPTSWGGALFSCFFAAVFGSVNLCPPSPPPSRDQHHTLLERRVGCCRAFRMACERTGCVDFLQPSRPPSDSATLPPRDIRVHVHGVIVESIQRGVAGRPQVYAGKDSCPCSAHYLCEVHGAHARICCREQYAAARRSFDDGTRKLFRGTGSMARNGGIILRSCTSGRRH
jgi:hypothetical protein